MGVSGWVRKRFLAELQRQQLSAQEQPDGSFVIQLGECTLTANLENLSREFEQTGDESLIVQFVQTIGETLQMVPPNWEQARARLYLAAESNDHDFGDVCHQQVSDQVALVLVYVPESGHQILWVTPDLLQTWGVCRERAEAYATDNLARLLDATSLETIQADGHLLGMLATHSPLKASLIFAPNLRAKVEATLGWPILAVIPTRDFCYLLPRSAEALLGRIGQVVISEYTKRGYPISTEVFCIDEAGPKATGAFQSPFHPPPGMQAIHHDEILTFFLPREWQEDNDANDEPIYFDPAEESNYLSVVTQQFRSSQDIDPQQPHRCLQTIADQEGVEVEDWPGGRAAVHFQSIEDDMYVWTWAICGPISPRCLGLAVFSHHEPLARAESEEVQARIDMLRSMLPRCLFRDCRAEETDE
ncbi:MAG: hypothetical protein SNJ82_01810 [Gemmataceae bacterium]